MPTGEPIICRQFSLPSSLVGIFDSALAALVVANHWVVGDSAGAATVADVIEKYRILLDQSWEAGCHMVGQIIEIATTDIPVWCLPCDGSTYADVDYPELAAVIHVGLRVDGSHFRTPDRETRFGLQGPIIGSQAGEQTHTLSANEMPAHTHTYTAPFGEFLALGPGEEPVVLAQIAAVTGSAGLGLAHNNMPPYEGTRFVIVAMSNG